MEHVEDVPGTYNALHEWLRPGGFMSHNIDFRCHGLTRDWNGHWTLSDGVWRLVKGTRAYLINRVPHSAHLKLLQDAGFIVVNDLRRCGAGFDRQLLAPRFVDLSELDLSTTGTFIQARKPQNEPRC